MHVSSSKVRNIIIEYRLKSTFPRRLTILVAPHMRGLNYSNFVPRERFTNRVLQRFSPIERLYANFPRLRLNKIKQWSLISGTKHEVLLRTSLLEPASAGKIMNGLSRKIGAIKRLRLKFPRVVSPLPAAGSVFGETISFRRARRI